MIENSNSIQRNRSKQKLRKMTRFIKENDDHSSSLISSGWVITLETYDNCWRERDIAKELSGLPREVADERQRGQQQEIAAAAENRQVGRPTCTTCTGSRAVDRPVDRNKGSRPAGRPKYPDCKCPTLCCFRATDRSTRVEVGRPAGRPTVGFGRKSAVPKIPEQQGI